VKAEDVRRTFLQKPDRRRLAALAWESGIQQVEEQNFLKLSEQVRQQFPDWEHRAVNLAERLPAGASQSASEWAARQAILEHRLLDGAIEFQGTGDFIVPTRTQAGQDLQSLVGQLFSTSGGLAGLGQVAPPSWTATAQAAAEAAGRRSVRVTRVTPDTLQGTVAVESHLLALNDQGVWDVLWTASHRGAISKVRAGALEQVRNDPQVQQVVQTAKTLGLSDALEQALAVGAVTLDLQQQANDDWFIYSDRFIRRIDSPPLSAVAAPQAVRP
jgi:hypothetical protein